VLAANVFALLGLRALFFLVSGLLDRLVYLPELSTGASLGLIVVILAATTIASLRTVRRDPTRRAHPGSLRPTRRSEPAVDTR
jgi:tellurite resistance protein TerC